MNKNASATAPDTKEPKPKFAHTPPKLPAGARFIPSLEGIVKDGEVVYIRRTRRNPERAVKNALKKAGKSKAEIRAATRAVRVQLAEVANA